VPSTPLLVSPHPFPPSLRHSNLPPFPEEILRRPNDPKTFRATDLPQGFFQPRLRPPAHEEPRLFSPHSQSFLCLRRQPPPPAAQANVVLFCFFFFFSDSSASRPVSLTLPSSLRLVFSMLAGIACCQDTGFLHGITSLPFSSHCPLPLTELKRRGVGLLRTAVLMFLLL